ncbi:MAG TPA: acyl-CoA dehydrogenase family protein [Candidatus Hydrogenedentes bacterium]|nr:acyl-CoA dehydrogenase family protein [Candidatus Hydrogenedentota bacterium]
METAEKDAAALRTLPGDDVRQILWRFADRYDLQMLIQATRAVARGPVARLVAEGGRNTHEWTEAKAALLKAFDESGLSAVFLDPDRGGFVEGPKNMASAVVAFELAWVDGGAATCCLANNLALAPIHECGTPEQRDAYLNLACNANGERRRGAFALTEPLPYVGVETGMLCGKMRIAAWEEGQEPMLQIEKRGRFITNMDFATFVTAAVESDDARIKGSCIVILEESDPGVFDRGAPTLKLVHQLSSTRDPVFSLRVPASRIVGGYTVQDGVIVPNVTHGEAIEAVFRRTRVPVGLMTAAKLLSAVEPVIRYQRSRFRGGSAANPGTPRYDVGLQQREDALHRLADVWATGEAASSLGFATARLFDELDPLEKQKNQMLAAQGISGGWGAMKALKRVQKDALEFLELSDQPETERDADRYAALEADPLVRFMLLDAQANVLCPAVKLWNTGHGATMLREAVSLMGGYGITEDCPGFLGQKWTDAQLEATYEGPEAVQRRQLAITMTMDLFLAQFRRWIRDMRRIASEHPGTGACALATGMELWLWTIEHLQKSIDADGSKLYNSPRQGVSFPMADALCWLLAVRSFILDVLELEQRGPENPVTAEGLAGLVQFMTDLCHLQTARAVGEAGRICAELVYGYNRHPAWEGADCTGRELKAGPCVCSDGLEGFVQLRTKLDACLTGSRLAKDRAAQALKTVMIPEALDYPA